MKRPRYLDYAIDGNVIYPLLFLDSEQYLQVIDDCEAGKLVLVNKLNTRRNA